MLAISRAMLAKPKLMMLDEPSLGLSPILVSQLFELIRDLNRDGLTIILVEQNTNMALQRRPAAMFSNLGRSCFPGLRRPSQRQPAGRGLSWRLKSR